MNYVYMHQHKQSGKIYIGISNNPLLRFRGGYTHVDLGDLEEKFFTSIITAVKDRNVARALEQYYISLSNSWHEDYGYNIKVNNFAPSKSDGVFQKNKIPSIRLALKYRQDRMNRRPMSGWEYWLYLNYGCVCGTPIRIKKH